MGLLTWLTNLNFGQSAGDGKGDGLRTSFLKISNNLNFLKRKTDDLSIKVDEVDVLKDSVNELSDDVDDVKEYVLDLPTDVENLKKEVENFKTNLVNYEAKTGYNRLLEITGKSLGSSLMLSISGTRPGFVVSHTFLISFAYPGKADITQLTGSLYQYNFNIRLLANAEGDGILDVDFKGDKTVICVCVVPLSNSGFILNKSYTNGNDIPSGFTEHKVFTTIPAGIKH